MRTFTLKERVLARLNLLPIPIYDCFAAPLFGHALALATRLGIFDELIRPSTAGDIAAKLKLNERSTELLLNALTAGGYLRRAGRSFRVSPTARKWLLKTSPHYLGNFIRYLEILYTHWRYLDQSLARGAPPSTYIDSFSDEDWKIYVYGMMDLAKIVLPYLKSRLLLHTGTARILDLGGSHGLYAIDLCQRYPAVKATIVDFPQALRYTENIVAEHKLAERISLVPGNVLDIAYEPESSDAVLAFNLIHGFSSDQIRLLLGRAASAIRSGGKLWIVDQFATRRGSRVAQLIPQMVGLNLLNEVGGSVYNIDEIRSWCVEAGLSNMQMFRLRLPGVILLSIEKRS